MDLLHSNYGYGRDVPRGIQVGQLGVVNIDSHLLIGSLFAQKGLLFS